MPAESFEMWTERERILIQTRELFLLKPGIMKKAEAALEALRDGLRREIESHPTLLPEGVDGSKGQIARGENHKGFPFISLDLPQKFNRTEFFTYRTLFWWGHYLGFSLILKGPAFEGYIGELGRKHRVPAGHGVYLALNENPWEWEFSEENFVSVAAASADFLQEKVAPLNYIKLVRFFPVSDPGFSALDWQAEGVRTYRDLTHLVLPQA